MRALLIGGGGREHAMGLSIVKSGTELVVISPNQNPGLMRIAKKTIIGDENDGKWVLQNANKFKPDYVFIGPESPIAHGISDILVEGGFKVFAPSSKAARLETSKAYCRLFMSENHVGGNVESTPFSDPRKAEDFIRGIDYDFVIKPDGLTGGKGVVVQGVHFQSKEDGIKIAREYLASRKGQLLIEKKMVGEEFSLQAFVSGSKISFLPIVQDYKRALEGDKGPNTGGMGSICFSERGLPFIGKNMLERAKGILEELVKKFNKNVTDYVGPIYGGFIATSEGPKLLEINARLGDPEAINVLSLMDTSIADVAIRMLHGETTRPEFIDRINVLRYVVPKGYGTKPIPSIIDLDEEQIRLRGLKIFYASVDLKGKKILQTTSRSIALMSEGNDISQVTGRFSNLSSLLKGDYEMRNDIGTENSIENKKKAMKAIMSGKV
ncbi:MAG: phosphoribosylamine--glycine ligase [Thermoplasmatales archaeon]